MNHVQIRLADEADLAVINDIYNHYVLHSTCTYQLEPERMEDRRKKLGSALLEDQIRRAREIRHHTILAIIDADQAGSIGLHERFGFSKAAHLKQLGFKFNRWLDVVYMQLML